MPRSHRPYPLEFRQRLIELVRKGRTPEELARQFEPSAQAIRNWMKQAALDAGERTDGLTTEERDELRPATATAGPRWRPSSWRRNWTPIIPSACVHEKARSTVLPAVLLEPTTWPLAFTAEAPLKVPPSVPRSIMPF